MNRLKFLKTLAAGACAAIAAPVAVIAAVKARGTPKHTSAVEVDMVRSDMARKLGEIAETWEKEMELHWINTGPKKSLPKASPDGYITFKRFETNGTTLPAAPIDDRHKWLPRESFHLNADDLNAQYERIINALEKS